jgi:DOPA 4,5-dioxygenase
MKAWNKSILKAEWDATQAKIKDYHIHIYFNAQDWQQEMTAQNIAQSLQTLFPNDVKGVYNVGVVGPHSAPNVELDIKKESFGRIVQWLQQNGNDLSILIHPETGDDMKDHLESSLWLNRVTPYNDAFFDRLRAGKTDAPVKKTGLSPN